MLDFGMTLMPDPPSSRLVELTHLAEANGFTYGWLFDSHLLWMDPYPLLTLMALATQHMRLGTCVTNPGTREPSVTASVFATLNEISGGRMVVGIGRGDSARRVMGKPPTTLARLETAIKEIRALGTGEEATDDDHPVRIPWASGGLPIYVAAYGPKALRLAGRVGDGVILQFADPDLIRWCLGFVREGCEEAGREWSSFHVMSAAPTFVTADLEQARAQVRWFPAMVSNHVVDLVSKYPPEDLPPALTRYVRNRPGYDYQEHGRVGAHHAEFVTDDVVDRFCVIGTEEQCVEKLHALAAAGVNEFNIYLMTDDKERTLTTYGERIIPQFTGKG
ncbi:MAG TPA: TIGR03842 family LLM class F420-dependent oxidoreductase [Chloroflexota bacterium]|nr:TIGR03842 family LLM class F420-dependent oxidoreductase [Chloroflexota bacterium]